MSFNKLRLAVACVGVLTGSMASAAGNFIDQTSPTSSFPIATAEGSPYRAVQSFVPAENNSSGAGVWIGGSLGGSYINGLRIELYDNLPNSGGNSLAIGSGNIVSSGQFNDVFWTPVAVNPGSTYYLVVGGGDDNFDVYGNSNEYVAGQLYTNDGVGSFPQYDLTFREYAAAVPENSSFPMYALGLTFIFVVARVRFRGPST